MSSSVVAPVFAVVAVVFPVYLWGLIHVFGANKMPSHHLFRTIAGNAAPRGPQLFNQAPGGRFTVDGRAVEPTA